MDIVTLVILSTGTGMEIKLEKIINLLERIKEIYNITPWENLNSEEKKICCEYFVVMDSLFSIDEQISTGRIFNKKSIECRNL